MEHLQRSGRPFVTVIVPCRNEADHIPAFVAGVLDQDYPKDRLEIMIADGNSDDGTAEWLRENSRRDPRIRVIENDERIVPTGLNRAIESASGEIIVRMDVHTEYARDYVSQCVNVLQETGAQCVGGPWHAAGRTRIQCAIALAFQSPLASGGASSHALQHEGPVDSVYLGCWSKETLLKVGMFDEELVRNQDDELCLRLTRAGAVVWQSPNIRSTYYPRDSLVALWRQYAQYGYWKVRVIQKHRLPASVRHLVPGLFVLSLLSSAVLGLFHGSGRVAFLGLLAAYGSANLAASVTTCMKASRLSYLPIMPAIFGAFHFGYGYGFLRGVVDFALLGRGARRRFAEITRGRGNV